MSNMEYSSVTYGADTLILKRPVYEGIPVTLDFTNVTAKDAATGLKVVKAGSPINLTSGVVDNTGTASGILLFDVLENRPQGTILKKAYIDLAKAEASSGLTIDSAVKAALPMVVFE